MSKASKKAKQAACRDSGAAAPAALLLLLVASGLALAAGSLAWSQKRLLGTFRSSTDSVAELKRTASQALEILQHADPDEPDWPGSPLFARLEALAAEEGCAIGLKDLSSRFHINSLRKKMISETEIGAEMLPGTGADAFQQDRDENGFAVNAAARFGEFFEQEFLTSYATTWAYWNLNTADEFTLQRVFADLTGDAAAAERFHARVREQLKNLTLVKPEKLKEFIGVEYFDRVFPVINAFPSINVHFAPPWVLKQILSYPAFNVASPETVADEIVSLRASRPIANEELFAMIPVREDPDDPVPTLPNPPKEENRVFAYLGTVTWFWNLTVRKDGRTLHRVLARVPDPDVAGSGRSREYRVVLEELPW